MSESEQKFIVPSAPSPNVVVVTNISPASTEKELRDFFSFCGEIQQFQLTPNGDSQKALIEFARESAARTALLLSNANLGDKTIIVTAYFDDLPPYQHKEEEIDEKTPPSSSLRQEDKPKSSIVVELLANGYILGHKAAESAKSFDEQHGVSTAFKRYFAQAQALGTDIDKTFHIVETSTKIASEAAGKAKAVAHDIDEKFKVQEKIEAAKKQALEVDQKYHVSQSIESVGQMANQAWNSETGQKLSDFMQRLWKNAKDVNEAARVKALGPQEASTSSQPAATGVDTPASTTGVDAPAAQTTEKS